MSDAPIFETISDRYDVSIPNTSNSLRRRRPWFHVAAVLASLGTLALLVFIIRDQTAFESRPVSPAHRFFEQDCRNCHTQPFHLVARWTGEEEARFEHACRKCHTEIATADHHASFMTRKRPRDCTNCHQEHRGDRPLLEIHDRHCLRCHTQLESGEPPGFAPSISSWKTHPQFRIHTNQPSDTPRHGVHKVAEWNPDRGRWEDKSHLKFNHQFHLDKNGVLLPPTDPEFAATSGRAVLNCSDCHRPDGAGGMQPIVFETHCMRCHQLNIAADLLAIKPGASAAGESAQESQRVGLPHADVETVRAVIRERLVASRARPDRHGDPVEASPAADDVEQRIRDLELLLFATRAASDQARDADSSARDGVGQYCSTCHYTQKSAAGYSVSWSVKPPRLPNRWLTHAKFTHESHETFRCEDCHYLNVSADGLVRGESSIRQSRMASDILLPKIETCRLCHGATHTGAQGASDRCVTCHSYHFHIEQPGRRELREYLEK